MTKRKTRPCPVLTSAPFVRPSHQNPRCISSTAVRSKASQPYRARTTSISALPVATKSFGLPNKRRNRKPQSP